LQAKAGRPLAGQGTLQQMSIDARLEDLKRDLARLGERGGSTKKQLPPGGRGREADHPSEIPLRGWKDILWRSWAEFSDQNLFLITGGVTYAILIALFPGLAAFVSLYGLAFNTAQIEKQVAALSGVLPAQTQELLSQQLHSLAEGSKGALGFAAIVGLLLALWSASRGMSGLITGINIAYEEKERRSFFKFNLIALCLTLVFVVGGVLAIALIAVLPIVVAFLEIGLAAKWLLLLAQWPLLIILVLAGLAVLYRFGPDRDKPQWRWVTPGAIAATALWIVASIGFTVYVANFNSYDKTYGSLGGMVILLTWLYLSALMVLLGAVINAQSERQTRKDSTEGAPQALGRRGAHAADTLGGSSD
jgi:membrane protein